MPSKNNQLKIFSSISNLRKRITKVDKNSKSDQETNHAQKILEEINSLISLLDTENDNYTFDEISKQLKTM